MKFRMSRSISARFITILLLLLAIGQGVGACLFIISIRSGVIDALHERMKREVKQAAAVIAEPVVTYNTSIIEAYIAEALKDEDIQAIRVLDRDGNIVKEQGTKGGTRRVYTLSEPISFLGDKVGTVKIEYAAKTVDESMQGSLLLIPIYQIAMLGIVALVLVRLFNSYVKRPVEELNQAIAKISAGDLSVDIAVSRDDEIGTIATGVKYLAERLSGTVARINSNSDKVAKAVQQLNGTFDRVREVIESQNHSTSEISLALNDANESQSKIVSHTEQLLSLSQDNLSTLLQMRASSEEIAGTTGNLNNNLQDSYATLEQLAQSAKGVTTLADEVASFVSEASSSIEQVYQSVKTAEEMINESARLSNKTTAIISEKGMESISAATAEMKRIGVFIDSLMTAIEKLGSRSRDIGRILDVIEDVTAKSRLLSLNAQILAAQAGEQGKGFAVVAEEMKQLSDQSAFSTKEIDKIISVIQHEIEEVVSETRASVGAVRAGEAVVSKTADVLDEILATSHQATELTTGIERASREQTNGLRLVVNSTEQIRDKIHEVSSATSEQEKSTAFLLKALNPIKEAMAMTRRSTEEQAKSTGLISGNIELANQKNSEIASASADQQQLNELVLEALQNVMTMGGATVKEVNELLPSITAMLDDVEALRAEMAGFKTSSAPVAVEPAEFQVPPAAKPAELKAPPATEPAELQAPPAAKPAEFQPLAAAATVAEVLTLPAAAAAVAVQPLPGPETNENGRVVADTVPAEILEELSTSLYPDEEPGQEG